MKKLFYYAVSITLMSLCMSNIKAQEVTIEKKSESEHKFSREIRGERDKRPVKMYKDVTAFKYDKDQSSQRSELRLFKKFDGESINTTKTFDVESSDLSISLSGMVESGKINVKFSLPDGKEYKELEIDPASNVNWEVRMDSTEKVQFVGKWTIQIKAEKAVGMYNLRISTR